MILETIQVILGISYLLGKFITEFVIEIGKFFVELTYALGTTLNEVLLGIVAFEKDLTRAILLIYYGIFQIFDAFYITFNDLCSMCIRILVALSHFGTKVLELLNNLAVGTLFHVPQQLCTAVTIIGEGFIYMSSEISSKVIVGGIWIAQLPLVLLQYIALAVSVLIKLPVKIVFGVPPQGYIGLAVIALMYFIYCRFSLRLFLQGGISLCRAWINLLRVVFNFVLMRKENSTLDLIEATPNGSGGNRGLCVICQEVEVAFMASPCNHVSLCLKCCHQLAQTDNRCAVCRKVVKKYGRVYIP